jgi:hypothetical protein
MWEGDNGVAAARQAVAGGEVGGKVIEVVSGDTVVVRLQDGKDVRLSLARCRSHLLCLMCDAHGHVVGDRACLYDMPTCSMRQQGMLSNCSDRLQFL